MCSGHLSMIRQSARDKEEVRKKEKIERRQQELLEQNPLHQAKSTFTKNPKRLKHQVGQCSSCFVLPNFKLRGVIFSRTMKFVRFGIVSFVHDIKELSFRV